MLQFLKQINHFLTSFCVFPLILCLGGILTWKLRGLQFTSLGMSFRLMLNNQQEQAGAEGEGVSRYEAVAGMLAGNFGTGNIAGMAIAVASGGPGALLWIWIVTLFAAIVQYAGAFLGCKYRQFQKESQEYIGGPIACLGYKMGSRFLAVAFCVASLITAFSAGNLVQVNSIISLCADGVSAKIAVGILLALSVYPVLAGGNTRVLRFSAKAIPFVAGFYFLFSVIVLAMHCDKILPALQLVFSSALGVKAGIAGVGGYTLGQVISTGLNRAIMATDGGSGMVSILQSNSKSTNPVTDGLVTLLPPVIVAVVCSITMMVLLVTGAYDSGELGVLMVMNAFKSSLGMLGGSVVLISMILFGYTTALSWFACAEKSLEYMIPGKRANLLLKAIYIAIIPMGGVLGMQFIWALSDLGFCGMVIFNSISLIALFREVIATQYEVALLRKEAQAQSDPLRQ
ncbi:alanine/glycine:cation symporter family protein [Chlamydia trachomatis]|uniref:Na(+)-linked D-alanine glycine permease n=1 Tax=Chlamydia trachomatis serovar A (strain A2497) TaxID=580047 RepID=G4NNT0_CHLT4|nr:sodium:alanine symporter family protein [Chlamydia trachomatis]AEP35625.1 Na(+)-linked D-alanine glycine permease [Chlamydia trachomatis A2497]CAX09407.1 Na(+)-linked D-alanine glycine permease [Chlamydia trachomatis A2497]CAX10301.1 Na(+)-linked D-alanine glycine permease [Chlamydia trachomatis B/TZ1A828/OT]CCP48133.1 Na+/alanine symporter [Chlamydia trachomatis A/363]CCP49032.1 Na+/alanine symporter [Chlamydia trachomatis A/5291]